MVISSSEMLVDPTANTPLKISVFPVANLMKVKDHSSWTPPLKLTEREDEIVRKKGTVLVLGRSGTGKTLTVCNRMSKDKGEWDEEANGRDVRQLFVSRTKRLCHFVEKLRTSSGDDTTGSMFLTIDELVDNLLEEFQTLDPETVEDVRRFRDQKGRVDYRVFEDTYWSQVQKMRRS